MVGEMMVGTMMDGTMTGDRRTRTASKRVLRGLLACCIAFGLMLPSLASAQDIQLEDVVTAEIEMPEAFYVLRASRLHYEAMEPRESFLPELYETVEKEPF